MSELNRKAGSAMDARTAVWLVLTRALSALFSSMLTFGLDVWVYRQSASYPVFAFLAMIAMLPTLALAPIAGVLVDRYNKKSVLMACELASIAAIALVAVQYFRGNLSVASIALATLTLSAASNVRWIAMGVAVSMLAPRHALDRINALEQSLEGALMVSGPLLGAAALSFFSLDLIICFDMASSFVACAALALIAGNRLQAPPARQQNARFWRQTAFGFGWIWRDRTLLRLLLFVAAYNFAACLFTTTSTPYILAFASNGLLGGSLAMEGAGALFMGALLARFHTAAAPERRAVLAATAFGMLMAVWGLIRSPVQMLTLSLAAGMLTTLLIASLQTTWQTRVPVDIQGKVFATRRMVSYCLQPVSILCSIPASEHIFAPLLLHWPAAGAIWGQGEAGALGMMLSVVGAALFAGCIYYSRLHGEVDAAAPSATLIPTPRTEDSIS